MENPMTPKLYHRAKKFLKIRTTCNHITEPFEAISDLSYEEQELVKNFLSRNHQVKFI